MVVLAFMGLAFLLFTNPGLLVRYILITAAVVGVIYLLMKKFIFSDNTANKDQKKFVKAARQTKKKVKRNTKQATQKKKTAIRKRNVSANHLTVIEGKKGKKKNRALH
jgi:uncharacterized membrane protein (DUF106 family)